MKLSELKKDILKGKEIRHSRMGIAKLMSTNGRLVWKDCERAVTFPILMDDKWELVEEKDTEFVVVPKDIMDALESIVSNSSFYDEDDWCILCGGLGGFHTPECSAVHIIHFVNKISERREAGHENS